MIVQDCVGAHYSRDRADSFDKSCAGDLLASAQDLSNLSGAVPAIVVPMQSSTITENGKGEMMDPVVGNGKYTYNVN